MSAKCQVEVGILNLEGKMQITLKNDSCLVDDGILALLAHFAPAKLVRVVVYSSVRRSRRESPRVTGRLAHDLNGDVELGLAVPSRAAIQGYLTPMRRLAEATTAADAAPADLWNALYKVLTGLFIGGGQSCYMNLDAAPACVHPNKLRIAPRVQTPYDEQVRRAEAALNKARYGLTSAQAQLQKYQLAVAKYTAQLVRRQARLDKLRARADTAGRTT